MINPDTGMGPHIDIVMSSRVRIARNLKQYFFPHRLNTDQANELAEQVRSAVDHFPEERGNDFQWIKLKELDPLDRLVHVENHMISPALADHPERGRFFVNSKSGCSIMVNEEDHIRIQCMMHGFRMQEAWTLADQLDDWLGRHLSYAFDDSLGYVTACPTNLGTGIRISLMLHLPALTMLGYTNGLIRAAGQLGIAVRGAFGEGSEYLGNLYQVSNQITLGMQELEIIHNMEDIVQQVIHKEDLARQDLLATQRIEVEDRIYRSLGILRHARQMTRKEAMQHLSEIKLGISLELINDCNLEGLHELMTLIQPANIQQHFGEKLMDQERDSRRAALIRKYFAEGGRCHVNE